MLPQPLKRKEAPERTQQGPRAAAGQELGLQHARAARGREGGRLARPDLSGAAPALAEGPAGSDANWGKLAVVSSTASCNR